MSYTPAVSQFAVVSQFVKPMASHRIIAGPTKQNIRANVLLNESGCVILLANFRACRFATASLDDAYLWIASSRDSGTLSRLQRGGGLCALSILVMYQMVFSVRWLSGI